MSVWISESAPIAGNQRDSTRTLETRRRHALEDQDAARKVVQSLELRLGITTRWVPESAEWQEAGRLVAMRTYRRSLDALEGLIVARMFELTKMNRSGTGRLILLFKLTIN